MRKQDPVGHFARSLTPAVAERLGYGFALGIAEVLPQAAEHFAREMNRKTLPIRELWRMAGMGESHFYKLIRQGRGPHLIREGASHMVTMEEADRWLADLSAADRKEGWDGD